MQQARKRLPCSSLAPGWQILCSPKYIKAARGGGDSNMCRDMLTQTRMKTLLLAALLAAQNGVAVFAGNRIFDQREQFILSEINRIRAEQGLSQLRPNPKLCAMARRHSSNMAETGNLSHTDSLGRDFKDRLQNVIV